VPRRDVLRQLGRHWWPTLAQLAISVGLVTAFVAQVGSEELMARLASSDPLYFLIACGLFLFGQVLNALRWRWLLSVLVSRLPSLARLMTLVMVGMFFNFFLPSTVGGDVVRAELVRKSVGGRTHAYMSILVGRILAFVAILAIGIVAMVTAFVSLDWIDLHAVVAVLIFSLPVGALWLLYRSELLKAWWLRVAPQRLAETSARVMRALDIYADHRGVLIRVFAVAIIANLIGHVGAIWVLSLGLGLNVPFYYHLIAVPLILLITLIPVSFNGIGIREGAFAFFYSKMAVATAASVSLSLTFTAVLVALSLLGGLCLFFLGASGLGHMIRRRRIGEIQ